MHPTLQSRDYTLHEAGHVEPEGYQKWGTTWGRITRLSGDERGNDYT
jgi:hypothetical protein